jgi:signal transduction histidine kinase
VSFNKRETETINLNDKVSMILVDLEMVVKDKNATVEVHSLPVINGYKRQIQQLFQNLISNALKYSKPGIASHIEISSKEVKGSESGMSVGPSDQEKLFYMIEVKDNGIGFNPASAEKIFGMFQRLHGNSEYSGTGIGLAIARKVVENHHGYIKAESEEGKGATFRLLLPK